MPKYGNITLERINSDPYDDTANPDQEFLSSILIRSSSRGLTNSPDITYGGQTSYLDLQYFRDYDGATEVGDPGYPYASFAAMGFKQQPDATDPGGGTPYTRLALDQAGTLNAGGSDADSITVPAGAYFRYETVPLTYRTAIRTSVDLILVTRASGDKELYVAGTIAANDRLTLQAINEAPGVSFPADEAVTFRWIQPVFRLGPNVFEFRGRPIPGESLTYDSVNINQKVPAFYSASHFRDWSGGSPNLDNRAALVWGGFDERSGQSSLKGSLYGDGRVECISVKSTLSWTPISKAFVNANNSIELNPSMVDGDTPQSQARHFQFNGSYTLDLTWSADFIPEQGMVFKLVITVPDAGYTAVVNFNDSTDINWRFSGGDDVIPVGVAGIYKYEGLLTFNGSDYDLLMTRTEYV